MRCPICGKEVLADNPDAPKPFCSERCRSIDLRRWLNEEYSIETLHMDVDEIEKAVLEADLGVVSSEERDGLNVRRN